MKIVEDFSEKKGINRPELEIVQKKKVEYKMMGTFLRTPGLKLFYYDTDMHLTHELHIAFSNTVQVGAVPSGVEKISNKYTIKDSSNSRVDLVGRFPFFEALNQKNANKRVQRYEEGRIKQLENLRRYNPDAIKELSFFK